LDLVGVYKEIFNTKVLIICFIGFLADLIGGVMTPTQTLFALELGASLTFIGVITAISTLFSLLTSMPVGVLSDRFGRKPLILGGFILRFMGSLLYGTAFNPYQLLIGQILFSMGAVATFMNLRAYIADSVDTENLSNVVSIFSAALGIGVTLGPLIGGYISADLGYREGYLTAAALSLMGILTTYFGIKNIILEDLSDSINQPTKIASIIKKPDILWVTCMNIINFTIMVFILTYFPILGSGLGYSSKRIGFIFFIRGIATTIIRIPIGVISQRKGESLIMSSILFLKVLGLLAFPLTENFLLIILLMTLQGLTFGGYHTTSSSFLLRAAPKVERGITLGTVSIFQGMFTTASSYLIGYSMELLGINQTYLITGIVTGISFSIITIIS
jgi:MFS family permease